MTRLSSKTPKARMQGHRCDFCIRPIQKGEVYGRDVFVDSGDILTFKYHLSCQDIAEKLDMFKDGEGVSEDMFQEIVMNEFEKIKDKPKRIYTWTLVLDMVKKIHLTEGQ